MHNNTLIIESLKQLKQVIENLLENDIPPHLKTIRQMKNDLFTN